MSLDVDVGQSGGLHCETTTLGVLLRHAGVDLTEPMRFGLGAGLGFIYWDSKRQAIPFLGGRVKPFEITQNLAQRLGLQLVVNETTSAQKAFTTVMAAVDAGVPVGLQLDSYYLDYFSPKVHFAGHFAALYGRDANQAFLVETAQQGGLVAVELESLARARAARGPMAARHRSFTIASNAPITVTQAHLVDAMRSCAAAYLEPPIANLGHRGIKTTAQRITTWLDRVEQPERDLADVAYTMEHAGTGGALFRNLYRDFLDESLEFFVGNPGSDAIAHAAALFGNSATLWTEVAGLIQRSGASGDAMYLDDAAERLKQIHTVETDAMTALTSLGSLA